MTNRFRWWLIAGGALGLTLAVTWPLPRCLGSCLGAPPDTLLSVYFLAWVAHGLVTPGVRLLDASMFAPYPGTLPLGEYMPGYATLAIPAIALTGNPLVPHNLLLLLSYTLAALGVAALTARLTGALGPALLAGVAFAYSPRLLDQSYNVQTLAIFWFPWLLLALERFLERPTWPRAALAAGVWVALALSCLNLFVYGSLLAGVFVVTAVTLGGRRFQRTHWVRLAGVGAPALALLMAYLSPNHALAREWGLGRTLAEVERYSASIRDFVAIPREPVLHRLVGLGTGPDPAAPAVPGVTAVVLALSGLIAVGRGGAGVRRALAPYLGMAAVAVVLALGPTLATSRGAVPLPYRLLYAAVPGFDAIRTPTRFLVFVELGVAILVAVGAAWGLSRLAVRGRALALGLLAALILVESVELPYSGAVPRLDPAALPAVYRWLERQEPKTVALGIPMGDWVNIAAAAFHLRRTVNGWSSYVPPHYPALVEAMDGFPDERTVALVEGLGVDVVLIDREWLTPARAAHLARFQKTLTPERAFATHLVYRVARAPRPGLEALEASAGLVAAGAGGPPQGCVTLRNRGPGFVPLYPLHRLHFAVEASGEAILARAVRWLPLDLAPGAAYTGCVPLRAPAGAFRARGEVEGGERVYRFAVTAGAGPEPLAPAEGPPPAGPDRSGVGR